MLIEHFRNELHELLEPYKYTEQYDEAYWKFTFTVEKAKAKTKVKVKIAQATAEVFSVEFKFVKGSQLLFHKVYKEILDNEQIKIFNDVLDAPAIELVREF